MLGTLAGHDVRLASGCNARPRLRSRRLPSLAVETLAFTCGRNLTCGRNARPTCARNARPRLRSTRSPSFTVVEVAVDFRRHPRSIAVDAIVRYAVALHCRRPPCRRRGRRREGRRPGMAAEEGRDRRRHAEQTRLAAAPLTRVCSPSPAFRSNARSQCGCAGAAPAATDVGSAILLRSRPSSAVVLGLRFSLARARRTSATSP